MKRVILTGAVALALTACQTAGETFDAVNPFSDSVSIETRLIDQYLAEQGLDDADFPVPEAARRTPDLLPPGTGTEVAYADHYGVLEIPAAERELNAILQRLQATIPGTPPPARVYIEPGVGFSARAEKSGAIFVSFGGLSGTSPQGESDEADLNDDRLAFLIAHEYAHILLDHFGDRETEESMLEFAKLARMGLVARNKLDGRRRLQPPRIEQRHHPHPRREGRRAAGALLQFRGVPVDRGPGAARRYGQAEPRRARRRCGFRAVRTAEPRAVRQGASEPAGPARPVEAL